MHQVPEMDAVDLRVLTDHIFQTVRPQNQPNTVVWQLNRRRRTTPFSLKGWSAGDCRRIKTGLQTRFAVMHQTLLAFSDYYACYSLQRVRECVCVRVRVCVCVCSRSALLLHRDVVPTKREPSLMFPCSGWWCTCRESC